jgi:sn-glycerol 3-phosphate transport system permease protein
MTSIPKEHVGDIRREQARTLAQSLGAWLPERWYVHAFLWVACFILGLPLLYALIVSTQTNSQVFAYQFTPGSAWLDNFNYVMGPINLGRYMLNSTIMAITITIAKTILSLLAGLAFVYFRFPGKWLVFGFVLITLMMPTEILIIALARFVSEVRLSLTNIDNPTLQSIVNAAGFGEGSLWPLIVPFMASATGTFLFRQHFANIPAELSEAAQLDGASPLQFLFRVLVPISWNTIGALAVIQFVYAWNMYLWPRIIIQGEELQVVQVGLRQLVQGDSSNNFGPMMMGAVLASIPPVLVFILLQKQFMSGFALSRDK